MDQAPSLVCPTLRREPETLREQSRQQQEVDDTPNGRLTASRTGISQGKRRSNTQFLLHEEERIHDLVRKNYFGLQMSEQPAKRTLGTTEKLAPRVMGGGHPPRLSRY